MPVGSRSGIQRLRGSRKKITCLDAQSFNGMDVQTVSGAWSVMEAIHVYQFLFLIPDFQIHDERIFSKYIPSSCPKEKVSSISVDFIFYVDFYTEA